jgi:hypothetical protein
MVVGTVENDPAAQSPDVIKSQFIEKYCQRILVQ